MDNLTLKQSSSGFTLILVTSKEVLQCFLLHVVQTMWLLLDYFGSLTNLPL